MPRDYNAILKELRESKRRVDSLTGELETEKSRCRDLYIELTKIVERLRVEFGIEELPFERSGPSDPNRRTPESNLMISVGKIVGRCRQVKLTVEEARTVAIMEISNLAIEKYDLTPLPAVVLDQLEVSLQNAYFRGDSPNPERATQLQ
jgi:hypothetical protein